MMATRRIEPGAVGKRVAQNLAALRIARGLSQPQLAERLARYGRPIAAAVLSKTEQLDRRVDVDDLVALAIALGVTPNRLLLTGRITPDIADEAVELTSVVRMPVLDVWQWASGDAPLADSDVDVNEFRRENRPHDRAEPVDLRELRRYPELARQAALLIREARRAGVPDAVVHNLVDLAALTAINMDTEPSSTAEGKLMTEPAAAPEPQPVAAAIVTSRLGVLAGRRNDGKPPWTFIAGEVEPGEAAPFAAVREVKEETGLEARAVSEIGRRVHPKTGRTMIYIAAEPARPDDLDVFVGDSEELAEVRWLSLAEADELLPGMFESVHAYLEQALG
jgi:8-oxo-dGTP pyrophosphatase MutT (NUDIX family)/transcriptional regulator with XRE-family HTH domain